jgi:putative glutamine amidotransferase
MKKPIIIWGGADVDSKYYGQVRSKYAQQPNPEQDTRDFLKVKKAIENNVPVIGICRGAQLLCVHHGGSLYQHSRPRINTHPIATIDGKMFTDVAAGHHQIMRPDGHFQLVGWNPEYTLVWETDEGSTPVKDCAEIVYYPNTHCLAVQPHPEWDKKDAPFVKWLNEYLIKLEIDYSF